MSISLVVEGELWGLIVCHDYGAPRLVPYATRAACEVVGRAASMAISTKAALVDAARSVGFERIGAALIEHVAGAPSIAEGLLDEPGLLLGVCGAAGVALRIGGALRLAGETPDETGVERIIGAISARMTSEVVYATEALGLEHPRLADLAGVASGVVLLRLTRDGANAIVWFRPELVRSVTWAGDPQKAVEVSPEGTRWLAPRRSFAVWTEIVRGRSESWGDAAIVAVTMLRAALGSFLFERAEQLARVNAELAAAVDRNAST
jgi:chemotaxis family two-component system sensor kinase Cph1